MKLRFLGAAGTVTGSCFLFNERLLVDFGLYQGPKDISALNYEPLGFDPALVRVVMLTHAHLDHCGRLPLLVKSGFKGEVYMTKATAKLMELVLTDAVRVANHDVNIKPLYDEDDVFNLMRRVRMVNYKEEIDLLKGVKGLFCDAGHILGSASLKLTIANGELIKTIVFSGDLGNSPQDLIKPTEVPEAADCVVMESTYGDRLHEKVSPNEVLAEEVEAIERSRGILLIPCFSLQRTQEVLHRFNHLKREGRVGRELRVVLDGPMGIAATEVFGEFVGLYNDELRVHAVKENPFDFENLRVVRRGNRVRKLKKNTGPVVVIAGSGMMSGGRILSYAKRFLPLSSSRLLFVGYQGEETLGREILEKFKERGVGFRVSIGGKKVVVRASVRRVDMSAHADQEQLLNWLGKIKGVKKVFLSHGENGAREVLAEKIKDGLGLEVVIPKLGDYVVLSSGLA